MRTNDARFFGESHVLYKILALRIARWYGADDLADTAYVERIVEDGGAETGDQSTAFDGEVTDDAGAVPVFIDDGSDDAAFAHTAKSLAPLCEVPAATFASNPITSFASLD